MRAGGACTVAAWQRLGLCASLWLQSVYWVYFQAASVAPWLAPFSGGVLMKLVPTSKRISFTCNKALLASLVIRG